MQQLYLVIGGELTCIGPDERCEFRDPSKVEFVGAFTTHAEAKVAWKARAQATVDNALMRFFILPVDGLLNVDHHGNS